MSSTTQNSLEENIMSIHCEKLVGRLDANRIVNAPAILSTPVPGEAKFLLLNIADVTFIDSSGLGFLVALYKSLAADGQQLIISEPSSQARMLFELTRMHQIFSIYDNDEIAMAAIS